MPELNKDRTKDDVLDDIFGTPPTPTRSGTSSLMDSDEKNSQSEKRYSFRTNGSAKRVPTEGLSGSGNKKVPSEGLNGSNTKKAPTEGLSGSGTRKPFVTEETKSSNNTSSQVKKTEYDAPFSEATSDSIYQKLYEAMENEIDVIYDSMDEKRELHKYDAREGFTTCCPICADIHYRGDCLYDVTDMVLEYMNRYDICENIRESLLQHGIGGISFSKKEMMNMPLPGKEGKFRLSITCLDAAKAMCRAVLRMDAISEIPNKPKDGNTLRILFEKACKLNVLMYYPSMFVLTNEGKTGIGGVAENVKRVSQDGIGSTKDDFEIADDERQAKRETKKETKKVEIQNLERDLRTLYNENNTTICDVVIDDSFTAFSSVGTKYENILVLRCRKCGMPVAISAGQHDEIIVGMLGLTSAGKSSIIHAINYLVLNDKTAGHIGSLNIPLYTGGRSRYDLKFEYNYFDVGSGSDKLNRDLFASNLSVFKTDRDERFFTTILVTMCKDSIPINQVNLMVIDIAGEITLGENYHPIYYCANCFWFCLLPSQNGLPDGTVLRKKEDIYQRTAWYRKLFNTVNSVRKGGMIPVAVIYTRSDCYSKNEQNTQRSFIEYIYSNDGYERTDNIARYLISDNNICGINSEAMRDASMKILRFMADIRETGNSGYLSQLGDIERGNSEKLVESGAGSRSNDRLKFFEDDCGYGVFACSPHGYPPLDAEKVRCTEEFEISDAFLKDCRERKKVTEQKLNEANELLDNAIKGRKNAPSDASDETVEELDIKVMIAENKKETCERYYNEANEAYKRAKVAKAAAENAKTNAEEAFEALDTANAHPDPFGVMLPVIWSLGIGGYFLQPLVKRDGTVKIVDDEWLVINRTKTIIDRPVASGKQTEIMKEIMKALAEMMKDFMDFVNIGQKKKRNNSAK